MSLKAIENWVKTIETADGWTTCLPDPVQELRALAERAVSPEDYETPEEVSDAYLDFIETMVRDAAIGDRGFQSAEANLLQDIFL